MKRPIMIMGIMASGKSGIGKEIARRRGGVFVECDDWHPESNVAKMQAGIPLTDEDRQPWLERLADEVRRLSDDGALAVFSCSALKRAYREQLRQTLPDLLTVCLDIDASTATQRARGRVEHFMPSTLVDSQLATLERPLNERQTAIVDAVAEFDVVLEAVEQALQRLAA